MRRFERSRWSDFRSVLTLAISGAWRVLKDYADRYGAKPDLRLTIPIFAADFEARVNDILVADRAVYRFIQGKWVLAGETEAEVLRRILLRGDEDVAPCRQGDVQVEMVVSTVQTKLAHPGALLVDYGAGLGRVLVGLAQADRFRTAKYIAVDDEPMLDAVRGLASTTGASAEFMSRDTFLGGNAKADVIMFVNTLHHVPFKDVPRQVGGLLAALKPDGILLVHEMGELREPEQRNIPWRAEDLWKLFEGPFTTNARTTTSRSGVPLSHVLVHAVATDAGVVAALEKNVQAVWRQMKERSLAEVTELYDTQDEGHHARLQHALIINANLDLNRP